MGSPMVIQHEQTGKYGYWSLYCIVIILLSVYVQFVYMYEKV